MATKQVTKKKSAPSKAKAKPTTASAVRAKAKAAPQRTMPTDRQGVRFLIICFTILCVVFAAVAFWRYS